MSEQSQGPGWWLASDGRWYPPEQAPPDSTASHTGSWAAPTAPSGDPMPSWAGPPPAPVPPPRGMSTGAKVAIALASVGGVVLLLVLVVTLLGTSSDSPSSAPVTDAAPQSFTHFTDPDGAFSIDLHPAWVGLSLRGDVTSVGTDAAPDDPERAAAIDALVATLPRQVVFAAVDGTRIDGPVFKPNMNLIPVPREGATIAEIEVQIPHSVETFGAGDAHVERVTTKAGDGLRMTYRFTGPGPLSGVEGLQYYVFDDDTVWVLTMTSDDMASDRRDFDASASSFTLR